MSRFYNEEKQEFRRKVILFLMAVGIVGVVALFFLSKNSPQQSSSRDTGKILAPGEQQKKPLPGLSSGQFIAACVQVANPNHDKPTSETGFLYRVTKTHGYIVTPIYGLGGREQIKDTLTVFFQATGSGPGKIDAKVVNKNFVRDFVLLTVPNRGLPTPLNRFRKKKPKNGENVTFAAFEKTRGKRTGSKLSAPSLHGAKLKSSRYVYAVDRTPVYFVTWAEKKKIPGDFYALGPAFDDDGQWVGLAARHDRISKDYFLISPKLLDTYWNGHVTEGKTYARFIEEGKARVTFTANVSDPANSIKEIGIYLYPWYIINRTDVISGRYYKIMPGIEERYYHPCTIQNNTAAATVDLERIAAEKKGYHIQTVVTYTDGTRKYLKNLKLEARFFSNERQAMNIPYAKFQKRNPEVPAWKIKNGFKLASEAVNRKILNDVHTYPDFQVKYLSFPNFDLLHKYFWTKPGKSFVTLSKKGIIYHVSVPDFRIIKEIFIGSEVSDAALSRQGLVVMLKKIKKAVLVDLRTGRLKAVFDVPGNSNVYSSPQIDYAFATQSVYDSQSLTVMDLKRKRVKGTVDAQSFGKIYPEQPGQREKERYLSKFKIPVFTPDGKYMICKADQRLIRLGIKNNGTLVADKISPIIPPDYDRVAPVLSPGGTYVGVTTKERLQDGPHEGEEARFMAIYKVDDFETPVLKIRQQRKTSAKFVFDKPAGLIYKIFPQPHIIAFSPGGEVIKEYNLHYMNLDTEGLLLHPRGKQILLSTPRFVMWVTIGGELKPAVEKEWVGTGKPVKDRLIASHIALNATSPNHSLELGSRNLDGIKISRINLHAPRILLDIQWADDKKSFFAARLDGEIFRVSVPDLKLIQHFKLGGSISCMKWTSEGLAVVMNLVSEIRILDPGKPGFKRIITLPGIQHIAATRKSPVIYAARKIQRAPIFFAVDVRNGKVLDTYNVRLLWEKSRKAVKETKFRLQVHEVNYLTYNPAGNSLFTAYYDSIVRIDLENYRPRIGASSLRLNSEPDRIYISPDAQYIALPGKLKTVKKPHHPQYEHGIYFYNPVDLSKPVISIKAEEYQKTWAVDTKGKMVYGQRPKHNLVLYSMKGKKIDEYKFEKVSGATRGIIVHPDGKKMLVLTNIKLYWVDLAGR